MIDAIRKLNPSIVTTRGDQAFDIDGNKVDYDRAAVDAKVIELQTEEENKVQAAHDKLAALGLTPEDFRRILG
jgi:hypothetical protein